MGSKNLLNKEKKALIIVVWREALVEKTDRLASYGQHILLLCHLSLFSWMVFRITLHNQSLKLLRSLLLVKAIIHLIKDFRVTSP